MKSFFENINKKYLYLVLIIVLIVSVVLGVFLYRQKKEYTIAVQNQYNFAFYELIDYVQDLKNYLAKATISSSKENGAETLMHVWREANLAQVYLSQLPVSSEELSNTAKFLNQVSEYSYSLSRKCIDDEDLTSEEIDNLTKLYDYSKDLSSTLNQLSDDIHSGRISWNDLTKDSDLAFAKQVDNLSKNSFSNIDNNFGEYQGLIYDGAYSEHIESQEKKGLVGDEIDEEKAREIAKNFIGNDRILKIDNLGFIENGDIPVYEFSISIKDGNPNNPANIAISKKGGHIVLLNYNREITAEVLTFEEADEIGKRFLQSRNINNMKSTYYLKQGGAITINYAYSENNVTIYPDLIKLKIALDNGEILGFETSGYLNNHTKRNIETPKIRIEQAKENLNKNLEITSEGLAIIPTEWKTEILCYEFKGKINDIDFLMYVNANTGREEDILVIVNTPNGILTQ